MAEPELDVAPAVSYRTILDVAAVPTYALDSDGQFTYVNDALVDVSGYHRTTLLGEHVSLLLSDRDVVRCQEALRTLLESGTRTEEVSVTAEKASGERVSATLCISLLPLEGGFQGTVGVVRRIDEDSQSDRSGP